MSVIKKYKKTVFVVFLLCAMFFAGRGVGYLVESFIPTQKSDVNSVGSSHISASENWGLGGYGDGVKPTGIATAEELKKYEGTILKNTEVIEIEKQQLEKIS